MIDHTMADKQKPKPETHNSLPPEDEQSGLQNGLPKSYYYDDATGYEIYDADAESDEQGDDTEDEPQT